MTKRAAPTAAALLLNIVIESVAAGTAKIDGANPGNQPLVKWEVAG